MGAPPRDGRLGAVLVLLLCVPASGAFQARLAPTRGGAPALPVVRGSVLAGAPAPAVLPALPAPALAAAPAVPTLVAGALAELSGAVPDEARPAEAMADAFDGSAWAEAERLVDRARELFFPDGRPAAVVARSRGVRPEAVPGDEEMTAEMALSPLTYPERLKTVIELFRGAGASDDEIVTQDVGREQKNVCVVKKGRSDRVIVVSSHHDKEERAGAGTIDNWSGTTMVISLFQALRDAATEATIVFASFAREEDGLVGSARFLKALSEEQRGKIDANINLDTLAVDGTFSWGNNSTRSLLDLVKEVAESEGRDLKEVRLWGGDADSSSFRRWGIAAMTLLGVSPGRIFEIVHSKNDTMAVFSLPHYKNAYLLTLALLRKLDVLTLLAA